MPLHECANIASLFSGLFLANILLLKEGFAVQHCA